LPINTFLANGSDLKSGSLVTYLLTENHAAATWNESGLLWLCQRGLTIAPDNQFFLKFHPFAGRQGRHRALPHF
jgi:hypothetical protein